MAACIKNSTASNMFDLPVAFAPAKTSNLAGFAISIFTSDL